jgi:hypothetical protein
MALLPPDLAAPALFLGGRSGTSLPLAAVFIALAIGLRVLRSRGRGGRGGPSHGGPPGGGSGGTRSDPPVQWDIRKAPEPEATPDASSEEQNPPSDL